MTLTEGQRAEGVALLRGAIERPFVTPGNYPGEIGEWFRFTRDHLPLTTFQTRAYEALAPGDLPTTYPLEPLLLSVLEDEGWDGWQFGGEEDSPFRLIENLTARRRELGQATDGFFASTLIREERDGWRVRGARSLRGLTEPEIIMDWDHEGPAGAHTVYEEIGRELVLLVEHREAQRPGTGGRQEAQEAINAFLVDISARVRPGRPPRGTPDEVLRALHEQTTDLLTILWDLGGTPPLGDEAVDLLTALGVTRDHEAWAVRLAVPGLSSLELQHVSESRGQRWITPRRLSIFILAHRLGLEPPHVARRLVGADEEEEFQAHRLKALVTPTGQ
jgi:hypothetical protein